MTKPNVPFKLGSGAGLVGASQQDEFKYMEKADLIDHDKGLAKLFQDTESGKAPYKMPFRAVDGVYNGCAKCNVAGLPSHGGTVESTEGDTGDEYYYDENYDDEHYDDEHYDDEHYDDE